MLSTATSSKSGVSKFSNYKKRKSPDSKSKPPTSTSRSHEYSKSRNKWNSWKKSRASTLSYATVDNIRPDKLRVKLRYAYLANNATLTATVPSVYQFSGNGPYDPDVAGVGTSANMWANLSTWYNKYMCTCSDIWVMVEPISTSNYQLQGFFEPRGPNTAAATDYRTILAQPYGQFHQVQGTTVSKTPNMYFKGFMSTPKILGRKMDPGTDRVSVSSDPTEEWIWEMTLLSSATINANVEVRITYWVEFSDREAVSYL